MNNPWLLGGANLEVPAADVVVMNAPRGRFAFRRPHPIAYSVLASIAAGLRELGHGVSDVTRGKHHDVRCVCSRGESRVRLMLIVRREDPTFIAFYLDAWGWTLVPRPPQHSVMQEHWRSLSCDIGKVIAETLPATQVTWLSADEVDRAYREDRRN